MYPDCLSGNHHDCVYYFSMFVRKSRASFTLKHEFNPRSFSIISQWPGHAVSFHLAKPILSNKPIVSGSLSSGCFFEYFVHDFLPPTGWSIWKVTTGAMSLDPFSKRFFCFACLPIRHTSLHHSAERESIQLYVRKKSSHINSSKQQKKRNRDVEFSFVWSLDFFGNCFIITFSILMSKINQQEESDIHPFDGWRRVWDWKLIIEIYIEFLSQRRRVQLHRVQNSFHRHHSKMAKQKHTQHLINPNRRSWRQLHSWKNDKHRKCKIFHVLFRSKSLASSWWLLDVRNRI